MIKTAANLEDGIQDDRMNVIVSCVEPVDVASNPSHSLCLVHAEPVDAHESNITVSNLRLDRLKRNILGTKLGVGLQLVIKFFLRIRFDASFDDFVDVHFGDRTRTQDGYTIA